MHFESVKAQNDKFSRKSASLNMTLPTKTISSLDNCLPDNTLILNPLLNQSEN